MKTYHVELCEEEMGVVREALNLLYQKRREDAGVVKLVDKLLDKSVVE